MIHFDPIPPVSACRLHLQRKNQVRMVLPLKLNSEMLVLVACKTNHDSFRSNSACVRLSPAPATQKPSSYGAPLEIEF